MRKEGYFPCNKIGSFSNVFSVKNLKIALFALDNYIMIYDVELIWIEKSE